MGEAGRWLVRSIRAPGMAGIEASTTLGGIVDGVTYYFAGGLRQARSDTIGVMTHSSRRQPGCGARFPIAVCMSCPGVLKPYSGEQQMPQDTHETAPTQSCGKPAASDLYAYRRFGRRGGTPSLPPGYFTANLDRWDPKVTNGFAAERDVILVDYPGIGGSSGETPSTVAALTKACVEFCGALGPTRLDVLGFSLGGMIARQLAADHPEMVRCIILTGTGPRGGEGMASRSFLAEELDDEVGLITNAIFYAKRAEYDLWARLS